MIRRSLVPALLGALLLSPGLLAHGGEGELNLQLGPQVTRLEVSVAGSYALADGTVLWDLRGQCGGHGMQPVREVLHATASAEGLNTPVHPSTHDFRILVPLPASQKTVEVTVFQLGYNITFQTYVDLENGRVLPPDQWPGFGNQTSSGGNQTGSGTFGQ